MLRRPLYETQFLFMFRKRSHPGILTSTPQFLPSLFTRADFVKTSDMYVTNRHDLMSRQDAFYDKSALHVKGVINETGLTFCAVNGAQMFQLFLVSITNLVNVSLELGDI